MKFDKHNPWLRWTLLVMLFFILTSSYFFRFITQTTYLGISARKINTVWQVKQVQSGGNASESGVLIGDRIIAIDQQLADENYKLISWSVVEQANEITVERAGQHIKIPFKSSSLAMQRHLLFFGLSVVSLVFLLLFYRKQPVNNKAKSFYFFTVVLIFSFLGVVPSSCGDNIGRMLVIIFASFFPLYVFRFLNPTKGIDQLKKNLERIVQSIGIVNLLLAITNLFFKLPYFVVNYLAVGIFYVLAITLLAIFLDELRVDMTVDKQSSESQIKLPLMIILSFVPLFLFYILPTKWLVPFPYVVIFMIFPSFGVLHLLLLSRMLKRRKWLSKHVLYSLLSLIMSGTIFVITVMSHYVSIWILLVYVFFLFYAFLPLIEETLLIMKRSKEHSDGVALFIAVEDERESISTYIHDTVIQEAIYTKKQGEEHNQTISPKEFSLILEDIIFSLRELCSDIYPLMIQEIGLINSIESMLNQQARKYPVVIESSFEGVEDFSPKINNFILRSLKELLINSILHGSATKIQVLMKAEAEAYKFQVIDNGNYVFNQPDEQPHFGLDVIKEKLSLLGGYLEMNVSSETSVTIYLPYSEETGGL